LKSIYPTNYQSDIACQRKIHHGFPHSHRSPPRHGCCKRLRSYITNRHQTASKGTQLQFGFLKELGLEKPSWLPDFGGKKEEEDTTNDAPVATADDGDDAPAAEDDAPKED
jgi:hypothetical protein